MTFLAPWSINLGFIKQRWRENEWERKAGKAETTAKL